MFPFLHTQYITIYNYCKAFIYKCFLQKTITKIVKLLYSHANKDRMKTNMADFDAVLSPLEKDILKTLWPDKELKVRQIYDKLKGRRKVALSSVAVLLDRLHEKNIVNRKIETGRGGSRYIYHPCQNRKAFEKTIVETTVNKLIQHFGPTAMSYFHERFAKK